MKSVRTQHDSPRAADFRGEGVWATKLGFYLLWMEYLTVSPSYELARRYRAGVLTDAEREKLPEDFDTVLAVYDDLGDVQRVTFLDWWSERGLAVFGYEGAKPRVQRIDTLRSNRQRKAAERVQEFIEADWTEQGQPNAMLVSIPVGLAKTQITRQLGKLLARYEDEHRVLPERKAKYPLVGTRQRKDTLFRYLFVVWVRSAMPRQALWRVGVRARVSDTYSRELDAKARVRRGEQDYDRTVLAVLTSRAWSRGVALAENAARGRFPSYDMPEHAVEPNLHDLWDMIASRRRWKKQQARNTV
ncbi:hypothetical protein LSUCC0031_02210 [Rhodobacterales bacterium LSUCC0031]|nr:hypothetical protein [Rhodobacterales bacterium LSUCC0031]